MDNEEIARRVLAEVAYVVLATADAEGTPWASPVWFAHEQLPEVWWISNPGARHSRNLAARPELGMVVFDSGAQPLQGQGVYLEATAAQVTDLAEIERGTGVFSRVSRQQGGGEVGVEHVTGPTHLRLYRAVVREASILDPDSPYDVRVVVDL